MRKEDTPLKAIVIHEHGDVSCLRVEEVPEPSLGPDEVLVRVKAAAMNHLDIWVRRGRPGLELSMPHVLGSDAMGVVEDCGPGVRLVSTGQEVVLNPGLSCGTCEFCRRGEQSECLSFGIVGMNSPGTFAELIAVPAKNVCPKPPHLRPEEAAALPLAHLTAWRMLMTRARLQGGETVLIHGIGGGVALAGLQLAKLMGARVIVTSSSDAKLAHALEFGADQCVNYATNPCVSDAVRDLTGGRGVDVVLDAVGAATWQTNFQAVRRGGRIVHCGITTGAQAQVNISTLYWNHLTVMGSTMGSVEEFRSLLDAVATARLKPVLDSIHPMDRVVEATERMEQGGQFGKIVLMPGGVGDSLVGEMALAATRAHETPDTVESPRRTRL